MAPEPAPERVAATRPRLAANRMLTLTQCQEVTLDAFGLAHGGAGAAAWQNAVPAVAGTQFHALRLAGRESRIAEPLTDNLVEAAADTARSVADHVGDGPAFALVGVCYGAVVAYECARQLSRVGLRPQTLVLIDAPYGHSAADGFDTARHGNFRGFAAECSLLPSWVWESPQLLGMLLSRLEADVRAHTSYRWPPAHEQVADRVVAVTGRRVDVREAAQWAPAGSEFRIVDTGVRPCCLLEDEPARVAAAVASALSSHEFPRPLDLGMRS